MRAASPCPFIHGVASRAGEWPSEWRISQERIAMELADIAFENKREIFFVHIHSPWL
jgi:hypothetical protein